MDFFKITSNKNKSIEKKLTEVILNRVKDVEAIIDYGSHVVNAESKHSDYDYIVIIKNNKHKTPKKIDFTFKNRKTTLNLLTITDLEEDVNGKYACYFITKLINPCNLVYCSDFRIRERLSKCLADYLTTFGNTFLNKGSYTFEKFTASFLLEYINLFPPYVRYIVSKLKKNKEETWNLWVAYFEQVLSSSGFAKKRVVKLAGTESNTFEKSLIREKLSLRWFNTGIKIRKNLIEFPLTYISKNERIFHEKIAEDIMKFLERKAS